VGRRERGGIVDRPPPREGKGETIINEKKKKKERGKSKRRYIRALRGSCKKPSPRNGRGRGIIQKKREISQLSRKEA